MLITDNNVKGEGRNSQQKHRSRFIVINHGQVYSEFPCPDQGPTALERGAVGGTL